MQLPEHNILFFTRTMALGGTENVILQLCEIFKPLVNKVVVCSCGGTNVEKLNEMGIKHYTIPDIENKSLKTVMSTWKSIKSIINTERISIVHTHHRMAAFYIRLYRLFHKITVTTTLHGVFYNKRIMTKFAFGGIKIIACGDMVKKNFVDFFKIPADRITVIHNAVEKDRSDLIKVDELDGANNCFKIAYVGRLSEEKGADILIDAMQEVVKQHHNSELIFVGDGPLREILIRKVGELALNDNVIFLGYRKDAQNVIKQTDLVVLPSYTEGFPLTPIEAFAQGKPVVATRAGGTVDIVKDEVNGLLTPIGDSRELANAIIRLINDKDLYSELSTKAQKTYNDEFSFELFKKKIIRFYSDLCLEIR